MRKIRIHNMHCHVFTVHNIPARFLPFRLVGLLRVGPIAALIGNVLSFLAGRRNNAVGRTAIFCKAAQHPTQEAIFQGLTAFYPGDAKFALLSMDFDHMGAGPARRNFIAQLDELATLKSKYPDRILAFMAIDPRRKGLLELAKDCVEKRGFSGFKLYPPLGYYPFDERLDPVYAYARDRGLPVITHCSPPAPLVHRRGRITRSMRVHPITGARLDGRTNQSFCRHYADPRNYRYVLERHPGLKLCLGHAGGATEWRRFLENAWPTSRDPLDDTWFHIVMDLMEKHPTVWADVAYTAAYSDLLPMIKVFIGDPRVRDRIIYGSDSYMVQLDSSERAFTVNLRGYLGEVDFRRIAETNPQAFV